MKSTGDMLMEEKHKTSAPWGFGSPSDGVKESVLAREDFVGMDQDVVYCLLLRQQSFALLSLKTSSSRWGHSRSLLERGTDARHHLSVTFTCLI